MAVSLSGLRALAASLSVLLFTTPLLAKPGFPMMRKNVVQLRTRQPALVRLADTTVAFIGGATNPEYSPVEASLLATLETELLKNENTLIKKSSPAEAAWTLSLKVTGYSLMPPQQRTEGSGATLTHYTRWVGSLNVAYQVLDHLGKVHDAQNVSSNYDKEFNSSGVPNVLHFPPIGRHTTPSSEPKGKDPKTTEDVKQILINDIVTKIGASLGNTTRTLEILVATGEDHLNQAAVFMDDRLWSRALDLLGSTPAFPKPDEEAYRQYDLGLVYEAVSYDSKDAMDQRQNIYKAAEYYDKALEMNPRERYFVDSVARSKDAISRYKAIDDELSAAKKSGGKGPQNTVTPVSEKAKVVNGQPQSTAPASVFTAKDAIDLFDAQVPQEQIIEMIQKSPVQFDPLDKATVLAMAKAKLPLAIQNEMRKKVGAAPLGGGTPNSRPAPAARKSVALSSQQ